MAYLQLAKANSIGYLVLEGVFDVMMVLFVMIGYHYWGLIGTGIALSLSYFSNVLMVYAYASIKYGYKVSLPVVQLIAIQVPLGIVVYITTWLENIWIGGGIGIILSFVSLAVSVNIVHQKTGLWNALKARIASKFHGHD